MARGRQNGRRLKRTIGEAAYQRLIRAIKDEVPDVLIAERFDIPKSTVSDIRGIEGIPKNLPDGWGSWRARWARERRRAKGES